MAVTTLTSNAIGFIGNQHSGSSHRLMKGREHSGSQNWKRGAVLIRSSGRLAEAAADATSDIVGVAMGPSLAVTDSEVIYCPATPDMAFEATLEDETNVNHALVISNMYTDYAAQVDSSNNFYVDENDTTNTSVCIIAPLSWADVDAATVRARVIVMFLHDTTVYNT